MAFSGSADLGRLRSGLSTAAPLMTFVAPVKAKEDIVFLLHLLSSATRRNFQGAERHAKTARLACVKQWFDNVVPSE